MYARALGVHDERLDCRGHDPASCAVHPDVLRNARSAGDIMTRAMRILYVDDDPDIRTIVEMSLSLDPEIEVHAFGSGAGALEAIERDPWRPTAIILDYMMPEIDGVTLLSALRCHPDFAQTPAVFMTARGNDVIGPDLAPHGVAGVILKPFDPIELVDAVRALIAASG